MRLLLFTTILLCCSCTAVNGPDGAPLTLRLTIPVPSVCSSQAELPVELFLTNDGRRDIEVNDKGFGTGATYVALYDSIAGTFRKEVMGTVGDWLYAANTTGTVKLTQGQPYRARMTLHLPAGIFDRAGFYKLQVRYSGMIEDGAGGKQRMELESNWSLLEMRKCDAGK